MEAVLPWIIVLASVAYAAFLTREGWLVMHARPKGKNAHGREAWRRGIRMSIAATAFLLLVGIPLSALGMIPLTYVAFAIVVAVPLQLVAGGYAEWWAQAYWGRR